VPGRQRLGAAGAALAAGTGGGARHECRVDTGTGKSGFEREGWLRAYRVVRGAAGNFFMYARVAHAADL
jgi:hypothetical protein